MESLDLLLKRDPLGKLCKKIDNVRNKLILEGFESGTDDYIDTLKERISYKELKKQAKEIVDEKFGEEIIAMPEDSPYILLFSADSCMPCTYIAPSFARLASHFKKSEVYYTKNLELNKENGLLQGYWVAPILLGCNESSRVYGIVRLSDTSSLWNLMNVVYNVVTTKQGDFVISDYTASDYVLLEREKFLKDKGWI